MTDRITIENARITDQGVELKQSQAGKEYAQFTAMWSSSRKNRDTNETEYGPTKFVRVMVFGFKAGDVAAGITGGDRVNVSGSVEHHTWDSDNGPRDDWNLFADSVTLPVPRVQQQQGGQQQGGQQQPSQGGFSNSGQQAQQQRQAPPQQRQQPQGDPWNGGGNGFAPGDTEPAF